MTTSFFVEPVTPTIVTAPAANTNAPGSNLLNDVPEMTWRTTTLTPNMVFSVPSGSSIDCVALLYSNLRATDTVRVRAANSAANTTASPLYDSGTVAAYTGTKPTGFRTKTIISLPSAVSYTHWRIDITATGHTDGYVDAVRVVIGTKVTWSTAYMDYDCEQKTIDQSVAYQGANYTDFDEYSRLQGWKIPFTHIPESTWRTSFYPFLHRVGNAKPMLFVPNSSDATTWQVDAVFGRVVTTGVPGKLLYYDGWQCELEVVSIAS